MKQLQTDPWEGVGAKYPVGAKFTGKVTNVTDYGAFVELEPGVEGLVHVSEMSWVKKNVAPSKIVTPGTEVEVQVLEVDSNKRRISPRPEADAGKSVGAVRATNIRRAAPSKARSSRSPSSACSSASDDDIDGMVHLSDLSWDKPGEEAVKEYEKGQMVKAKVLDVDVGEGARQPGHQAARRRSDGEGGRGGGAGRARSSPSRSPKSTTAASKWSWRTALKASSAAPIWRATATISAPSVSARATRSTRMVTQRRQGQPQDRRSRSRRAKWPRRRKPWRNTVRRTPAPRSATSWAPRSRSRTKGTETEEEEGEE